MISVFIRTIIIYILLNVMLKIMGKRQIGELEVNELVSTLLISEIASIPIGDPNVPFVYALVPILFICALEVLTSVVKNRSNAIKKIIEGKPTYIIYKGRLCQDALRENRISINEILTEMRIQGIPDISKIYYAILEQNGKISLFSKKDKLAHPLIIDGQIDQKALTSASLTSDDLENILASAKLNEADVFLLTVNDSKDYYIIKKEKKN